MTSADIWSSSPYQPLPVRVQGLSDGPSFAGGLVLDDPPEDLSDLIAGIQAVMRDLQIERWSHLRPWSDDPQPQTADKPDLEALLERLCMRWADGQR